MENSITMKSYFGYNKPYIYAYCPHDCENIMEDILTPLYEQDVMFCKCDKMSKKELRRVEIAHAVVLFVNKTCLGDNDFHQVVNCAVQCGKNILTIYLEDVALDSWGHMQLDSAQALFRYKLAGEEFDRKLSEAAIFRDMSVTMQQKQFQRRRGIAIVAVPVLAVALIFTTVIYPLIQESKGDVIPGLKGLTQEELNQITELHICGDEVYNDANEVLSRYRDYEGRSELIVKVWTDEGETTAPVTRGTITDLSDFKRLKNLEVLEISAQQITDLKPIYKLKKLKKLGVECNPITSIEGIEVLKNLESLNLTGTDITDLTPIESLPKLNKLLIDVTYVTRMPNIGRRDTFHLEMRSLDIRDFSFLRDVESFECLACDGTYVSDFMPILAGKPIEEFLFSGIQDLENISQLDGLVITRILDVCHSGKLTSIKGIEKYDGIEGICLNDCLGLTDLTPLNKLKNVQRVELSTSMKPLVEAQISPDACFKIEYHDD